MVEKKGAPRTPEQQRALDRRWEKRFEDFFHHFEVEANRVEAGELERMSFHNLDRLDEVQAEIEERIQKNPNSTHEALLERVKGIRAQLPARELAGNKTRIVRFAMSEEDQHLATALLVKTLLRAKFWREQGLVTEEVERLYQDFERRYPKILPDQLLDTTLAAAPSHCEEDFIPKGTQTKRDRIMPLVAATRMFLDSLKDDSNFSDADRARFEEKYAALARLVGRAVGDKETGGTRIIRE